MMIQELRYTLLTDGASDDALIPLLTWLLREQGVAHAIVPNWADLRRLAVRPETLTDRILRALEFYPCNLLFIHRDAERVLPDRRREEILDALEPIQSRKIPLPDVVLVVPVRMTEAWLLFDERALRRSAGNPNGKVKLDLPKRENLEQVPDPKKVLYELLRTASELHGSRLKKFQTRGSARRVSELLDDFKPLRCLDAFKVLEAEIGDLVRARKWNKI